MVKIDNIELPDFPLLLAPMEDVSDPPFRALCKENGADVVYTEFISSEGLISGRSKKCHKIRYLRKRTPGWNSDLWCQFRIDVTFCRNCRKNQSGYY